MPFDYDLVAIGAGTAGLTVTRLVARDDKRVALVERDRPGGDCLWTGCVPTKALLHSAAVAHAARTGAAHGVESYVRRVDWAAVREHIERTQTKAGELDSLEALAADGVELVRGSAAFVDEHTLDVDGRRLSANAIVVATGSRPVIPPIEGLSDSGFDTNETALVWDRLPASLAVIGGGPAGLELGQAFARLGVQVTILEAAPRILPREEPAAAEAVERALTSEGLSVRAAVRIARVAGGAAGLRVGLGSDDGEESLECERILVAAGRQPRFDGLDLARAGVRTRANSRPLVDHKLRTSQRHIFVAGDAAGGPQFTHVAEDQARTIANTIRGRPLQRWSPRTVPRVTFTTPEVAAVGLTASRATERYGRGVRVLDVPLERVDRAITMDATDGFVRIVTHPGWTRFVPGLESAVGGEIAGATVVAPGAGDLLAPILVAMRARLPLGLVAWNAQPYPTLALGVRQAAGIPFDR